MMMLTAFLLGFLNFVKFGLIGSIALNEIMLLGIAVIYLPRLINTAKLPRYRSFLLWGLIYAAGLVFADLYRHTPASDYLRGWARLAFTFLALVGTGSVMFHRPKVLVAFLVGWFLAPLGSLLVYGIQIDLYKFYLALPVSGFAFLLVGYTRGNLSLFVRILPVLAGALAFMQNARSLAGITILAYAIYLFKLRRCNEGTNRALTWIPNRSTIVTGISILALCLGIALFYMYAAPRGILGGTAREKYEMQLDSALGQKFSLLAGRKEILFAWPKIVDSPLVGYGSWARDVVYVHERAAELDLPLWRLTIESREEGLIDTHSHIFSGWVEAGVLGAIFWCMVFWRAAGLLGRNDLFQHLGSLTPLFILLIVLFFWDLVFSPFGGERRFWNGFMIAWIAWIELRILLSNRKSAGVRQRPAILP